jgi:flagellar basal-body rod protein FlgG
MMRALWISATGMNAQEVHLDVIANNLANVDTCGYKKSRPDFEDLVYEIVKAPGTPIATGSMLPTGVQVGCGVEVAGTQKIHTLGPIRETGNPLDMAIEGDGFFQLLAPDGSIVYTRDGSFKLDAEGRLVNSNGYIFQPEIVFPEDTTQITITEDGVVFVVLQGDPRELHEIGRIELVKFINPAGLLSLGRNVYKETAASGPPIVGTPGKRGFGSIGQRFLEMSNVDIIDEMVNMIVAQRAYELNSRSIQTADNMLGTANGLKR